MVLSRRERPVSRFGQKKEKSTTCEPSTLRRSAWSRPPRRQRSACTPPPRRARARHWQWARNYSRFSPQRRARRSRRAPGSIAARRWLQGAHRSPLTPEPGDCTHTWRCAAVVSATRLSSRDTGPHTASPLHVAHPAPHTTLQRRACLDIAPGRVGCDGAHGRPIRCAPHGRCTSTWQRSSSSSSCPWR